MFQYGDISKSIRSQNQTVNNHCIRRNTYVKWNVVKNSEWYFDVCIGDDAHANGGYVQDD